jgi:hypothetical protein
LLRASPQLRHRAHEDAIYPTTKLSKINATCLATRRACTGQEEKRQEIPPTFLRNQGQGSQKWEGLNLEQGDRAVNLGRRFSPDYRLPVATFDFQRLSFFGF